MSWVTLAIAITGLGVSLTLAAIKVWETFLAESRFDVYVEWFDASDVELEMRFSIANVGHRADSVRGVAFISEVGEAYREESISRQLPVRLEPGAVSPQFVVGVRTDVAWDPGTSLFVGRGKVRVFDARGGFHDYPVANPYDQDGIYGAEPEPPPPEVALS